MDAEDLTLSTTIQRMVDNPLLTPAEKIEQVRRRPGDPKVGKVEASTNELTRIGALVYIRRRLWRHELAAARFKSEYEALFGLQPGALDMSAIRVDGGRTTTDAKMAHRIDSGARLTGIIQTLGPTDTDRLVAAIVFASPVSERVDKMPGGLPNGRHVVAEVSALLSALDIVAEEYGYMTRAA